MARKRVRRTKCPNCSRSLLVDDNYCANCGQENHTHKLPVRHFLEELLSGLFNFDTKLLRTWRDLFWPPGLVIKEFNANRRARYVHPLRLYLFTSVIFFVVLAWTTDRLDIKNSDIVAHGTADPEETPAGLTLSFGDEEDLSDSTLQSLSNRPIVTDAMLDSALVASGIEPGFWTRVSVRMSMNATSSGNKKADYVQSIFSAFSKLMFILLPIFAFLLFVMNIGTGRFYTEHLIFALYYHSVIFILLALRLFLGQVFDGLNNVSAPFILGFVYLTWAMHTVYARSWGIALTKSLLLVLVYTLFLVLGFSTAAVIGAL